MSSWQAPRLFSPVFRQARPPRPQGGHRRDPAGTRRLSV